MKNRLNRVYEDGIAHEAVYKSARVRSKGFSLSRDEHVAHEPSFVVQRTVQTLEHTHVQTLVEN